MIRGICKNMIGLCLAGLLCCALLTGCGAGTGDHTENLTDSNDSAKVDNTESDAAGSTEKSVLRIAVIDSGISSEAIPEKYLVSGKNYVDSTADTADTYGHGTAVASIIYREAGEVDFVLVPLVDTVYEKGKVKGIDADTLATAIREAVDEFECDIIQISGGVETDSDPLREAAEYAHEKGAVIVAAVGNDYKEHPGMRYYPAAYDTLIAVGAVDTAGERADFSQDWADEYVEGVDVPYLLMSGRESMGSASSYAAARYTAALIRQR